MVTFFGHRDAPESIRIVLKQTVKKLIETTDATLFYVGNQGAFDRMAASVLQELKKEYPHVCYWVVLAYRPKHTKDPLTDYSNTILPEQVSLAMPRFAISKRNDWMLEKSDIVLTYVSCSFGGAAKMKEKALRKGKRVIELCDQ